MIKIIKKKKKNSWFPSFPVMSSSSSSSSSSGGNGLPSKEAGLFKEVLVCLSLYLLGISLGEIFMGQWRRC